MNFEVVTIKDIAKELGISVSAVSKALKDSHELVKKPKSLLKNVPKNIITGPIRWPKA